ncbi:MAG TPA: hypothetical protein VD793_03205 [Gemmatimonadales bacterium]|nr:hypothetical protein [Gemmatimonadales bacterium]
MNAGVTLGLFLLGLHCGLRLVAALYRVTDLWYRMRVAYARVVGGMVLWAGAIAAALALLPAPWRSAYAWGVVAFVPWYLGLYLVRLPLVTRRKAPPLPRA